MKQNSVAVPVVANAFSAVLSLVDLNTINPIAFGFSKALTNSDTFNVYGTLDFAAVDATNAVSLGVMTGTSGGNIDPDLVAAMLTWPVVLLQRVLGSTAGSFFATGDEDGAASVASTALPAAGLFSALLNLTGFGGTVRIGLSALELVGDVFNVYVTQDSTTNPAVTGTNGARFAGTIRGGGEVSGAVSSLVVRGWPYAFVRRTAGATAGTLLASGPVPPLSAGIAWVQGGNAFGAPGVLGTLDAQPISIVAVGQTFLDSDGTVTDLGNLNATVAGAATSVSAGSGGLNLLADSTGLINIAQSGTGGITATTGTGAINIGANAADHAITIGSVTGASLTTVRGGTSGVAVTSAATGNISVTTGTTGALNLDSGTTGQINIGTTANSKQLAIGNITGTTRINLLAGTGGANVTATGAGNVTMTPGTTGSIIIPPRAAGAGDTSQIRFMELAASGVNYISIQAPDALASDNAYVLPNAFPTVAGMALTAGLTGIMAWANGISSGAANLSNGVSAAISTTITATSRIFVQATDVVPGAGNLTIDYRPLAADRVIGASGSFKITAVIAAGTINVLDQSQGVQWMVLNA